ncbi:hypothetical protein ISCGN_018058 [Ixodes scapularis]
MTNLSQICERNMRAPNGALLERSRSASGIHHKSIREDLSECSQVLGSRRPLARSAVGLFDFEVGAVGSRARGPVTRLQPISLLSGEKKKQIKQGLASDAAAFGYRTDPAVLCSTGRGSTAKPSVRIEDCNLSCGHADMRGGAG